MPYDDALMARALALSAQALHTPGCEPFGAVVARDGQIVGEGFNQARATFDPTSHGEVEAIRDACRRLQRLTLSDCELYTSCEPCALCVAAMHVVGIRRLFYAAALAQSDQALAGVSSAARPPIDVTALRAAAGTAVTAGDMPSEQHRAADATAIIRSWAERQGAG